jgi:hypothetical protein
VLDQVADEGNESDLFLRIRIEAAFRVVDKDIPDSFGLLESDAGGALFCHRTS